MVAQIIQNQIEKIEYRKKKIFWTLFSVFVFFIGTYGFLLNSIMMNAVSKQSMEQNMVSMNSNIDSLESQYLTAENGITLDLALSKGFVPVTSDKFAVINSSDKNISLSINEN